MDEFENRLKLQEIKKRRDYCETHYLSKVDAGEQPDKSLEEIAALWKVGVDTIKDDIRARQKVNGTYVKKKKIFHSRKPDTGGDVEA